MIVAQPANDDHPAQRATARHDTVRLQTISAAALYAKDLPPQRWVVPGILPAGATLFTGRGKDGKSLLVWNICLSVAEGGKALGCYGVPQGDVLYLALEDGERRAQTRLQEQMQHANMESPPARLELVLWDAPRLGAGLEGALTLWIDEHPAARLIVIDILEKVRPRRTKNGSVYADDYAALAPLQRLAQERNLAIVIVHHSNKSKPEDFRDTASGSMGLIASCDTFWSLQRIAGAPDAALHIIGRDVEAQELALQFKDGFWTVLGEADEYRRSKESQEVLDALTQAGKPQTPRELRTLLHVPDATLRKRLSRMAERGEIRDLGDTGYIPCTKSVTHVTPVTDPPQTAPNPLISFDAPTVTPPLSHPVTVVHNTGTHGTVTPVTPVTPVTGVTGVTPSTPSPSPSSTSPHERERAGVEGDGDGSSTSNASGLAVSHVTFPAAEKTEDAAPDFVSRAFPKAERSEGTLDTRKSGASTMDQAAGKGRGAGACALACAAVDAPPPCCPGCGTPTTWRDHPDYWECYKLLCGGKVRKAVQR